MLTSCWRTYRITSLIGTTSQHRDKEALTTVGHLKQGRTATSPTAPKKTCGCRLMESSVLWDILASMWIYSSSLGIQSWWAVGDQVATTTGTEDLSGEGHRYFCPYFLKKWTWLPTALLPRTASKLTLPAQSLRQFEKEGLGPVGTNQGI